MQNKLIYAVTGQTAAELISARADALKDNIDLFFCLKEDGTFGPIYGPQMRNQNGFDQLLYVINKLNISFKQDVTNVI